MLKLILFFKGIYFFTYLTGLWPSWRIWSVTDLNIDQSKIWTKFIISSDGIGTRISFGSILDDKQSMAFFSFDLESGTTLNSFTIFLPNNSWFGIAFKRYFNDTIFTFVKEGWISEPWRNLKKENNNKIFEIIQGTLSYNTFL